MTSSATSPTRALLANTLKPDKERIIQRRILDAPEATRLTAVACGHVGFQDQHIVVRLVFTQLRNPLRRLLVLNLGVV